MSDVFWYEPRWEHRADSAKFSGNPDDVRKQIKKWITKSRNNPLSDAIAAGLLRYCRALDLHDTDAVLLGLWGALENLTGTQNSKYEHTVSRIVRLFGDPDEAKLVAQHLRLRRNATVHAARSPETEEVDTVLFHAEWLVSRIIIFFIMEGRIFDNHSQALDFLDMDLDTGALAAKAALTKKFIDYRSRSGV